MNKRGSLIFYGLMLGLTIIILALALAPSTQEFTNTARTSMDCGNDSISSFYKASCVAVDLNQFQFIGSILLIGSLIVGAKIIF